MPNQCEVCRNRNKIVPCERNYDKICGFTSAKADQGENKMLQDIFVSTISKMWFEIVSISRREIVTRTENKKVFEYRLFTLEHIDAYLKRQCWEILNITENDAFYYISLFHRTYCQLIIPRA